jgi:flagellar hook-length control protein FliK
VREVAGDPLRTAPQSNTPQPVKGNAPTQSVNFSGGLAEAVDADAAEEVPASVNLTRRALRSLGRGHGGATVVQLRPAQFGKVTVRVQMEEGRVQADLVARTPEAARVLGEHLRLLRDSLEHKGLVVDRLEVREESKVESSRLDQHNENDADEDRSGGKRDREEGETSSKRSSPQVLGQLDERADEFGQVLMAAEEQA